MWGRAESVTRGGETFWLGWAGTGCVVAIFRFWGWRGGGGIEEEARDEEGVKEAGQGKIIGEVWGRRKVNEGVGEGMKRLGLVDGEKVQGGSDGRKIKKKRYGTEV